MKTLQKTLPLFNFGHDVKVPSFDELKKFLNTENKKGNIELISNGFSLKNNEIFFVKIGNGPKNIAITGGAHSDEPVGIATCFYLIKNLIENKDLEFLRSEFTFLIHPCLDPDGAQINFSWANTFSYPDYLLKNFRNNNPANDVEHGIPVKENQLPRLELQTLMQNLAPYENKLDFYVTLHTTHTLGGSLVLLFGKTKLENLINSFSAAANNLGAPMMDYRPRPDEGLDYVAPGFLKSPSYNDFLKTFENNLSALEGYKMSTYEWANSKLKCPICMIAEFPYLIDEKMNNLDKSDIDYIEFEKSTLNFNIENYHIICEKLSIAEKFKIDKENLWYKKAVLFREQALKSYQKDEKYFKQFKDTKATLGEVYYSNVQKLESEMKPYILLINLLKNIPEAQHDYNSAIHEFGEIAKKWEVSSTAKLISVETQVKLQIAMILSGLLYP